MTKLPATERPLSDAQREVLKTAPIAELNDAKLRLLALSQYVTPPAIASIVLDSRAHRQASTAKAKRLRETRKAFRLELRADRDEIGLRAAKVVTIALEQDGQAPTWGELGKAMGWTWQQGRYAIPFLAMRKWLIAGPDERSLRPGRRWTREVTA
jgi:hypothetical protein